jgi:hypothetical protein
MRRLLRRSARLVSVPPGLEALIAERLSAEAGIQFAEPDRVVKLSGAPDDPKFASAWHLAKIEAETAWQVSTGDSVTVAVLDTGIDSDHPDLVDRLVGGRNVVSGNGDIEDIHGHGTAVAGTVAAETYNGIGVASVAWNARIMPVRITEASNGYAYWSDVAEGLMWAADHGARVANISFGVTGSATVDAAAQYFRNKGGLVVVAAGNDGATLSTIDSPHLITVAATDSNDLRPSWSNQGDMLDVSAPGRSIWSTQRGGGYKSWSGTSFASPNTAGVAALIMAANPDLTPIEVEDILKQNSDDIGADGWDIQYGHGRINAARAVAAAAGIISVDMDAPAVAILSPGASTTVGGLVQINVNATDNVGVVRVELRVNGQSVGEAVTEPFDFSWDSTAITTGQVTLSAYAFDAAGNGTVSEAVTVLVDNPQPDPMADSNLPFAMEIMETGGSWSSVPVGTNMTDPVVIAGTPTYRDAEPGVVRLRAAAGGGFEARFQEWDYLDGAHGAESIPLLALEPGRYSMPDGTLVEVGRFNLGGTKSWKSIAFGQAFPNQPELYLTVQTNHDPAAVSVRARAVGTTGFQAALYEQESFQNGHGIEAVGYLAILAQGGDGTLETADGPRVLSLHRGGLNEVWKDIGGARLLLEEEQSKDSEVGHITTTVSVLRLDGYYFAQDVTANGGDTIAIRLDDGTRSGPVDPNADSDGDGMPDDYERINGLDPNDPSDAVADSDGDGLTNYDEYLAGTDPWVSNLPPPPDAPAIASAGFLQATGTWQSLSPGQIPQNTIVILGAPSAKDSSPGVLRMRQSSEGGFEVRFAEWDYLDGLHASEDAAFLVLKQGRHTLVDGTVLEVGTFALNGAPNWRNQTFQQPFAVAPKLFLTAQTANDPQAVTVRARAVSSSGFEASLFEQEAFQDGHAEEMIGYLAIHDPDGTGSLPSFAGASIGYSLSSISVDEQWKTAGTVQIRIEEEQSKDTETGHLFETLNTLTIDQGLMTQDVKSAGNNTVAPRWRP